MQSLVGLISVSAVLLLFLPGCSKEPSAEERRADQILNQAREAVARHQHSAARDLLLQTIEIETRLGRTFQLAETHELLADNYASGGRVDSALVGYGIAREHYKELAQRDAALRVTLQMADLYRRIDHERKAREIYAEELRLSAVFKDPDGGNKIRWAFVPCLRMLDETNEERRILDELLKIHTQNTDQRNLSRIHLEIGKSAFYREEYSRAVENFLSAMNLAKQAKDSLRTVESLLLLARTFDKMGRSEESFQMFTEGLLLSDRTRGGGDLREEMLVRVGNIYLRSRQFDEAKRFYNAALLSVVAGKNRLLEGYLLVQLGHCVRDGNGNIPEAVQSYTASLDLFRHYRYAAGESYALRSLGDALHKERKWNEALEQYRSALAMSPRTPDESDPDDLMIDCRNAYDMSRGLTLYESALDLAMQTGDSETGFAVSEARERGALFNLFLGADVQLSDQKQHDLIKRLQHEWGIHAAAQQRLGELMHSGIDALDLIQELHAVLDSTRMEIGRLAEEVIQQNSNLGIVATNDVHDLNTIQQLVPSGAAVIKIIPTQRSLYSYVVTSSRITIQMSAIEKPRLVSLANDLHSLLRKRVLLTDSSALVTGSVDRQINETITSLSAAIVRPIESVIEGVSHLILALPDELHSLPFHALRSSPSRGSRYMIEQHLISYLPYAGALSWDGVPMLPSHEVVGFGNAGNSGWDVEYELRDIRAFYKEARLYFHEKASLGNLKKEKGDILHIAAETGPVAGRSGNSLVRLADDRLSAKSVPVNWGELLSVTPFSMVIFSDLNEAAYASNPGLSSVFLVGGSSTVMQTSFTPLRKSKKFLGEALYTNLLASPSGKTAYRQAILAFIKSAEYSAPYHWASFFLHGK